MDVGRIEEKERLHNLSTHMVPFFAVNLMFLLYLYKHFDTFRFIPSGDFTRLHVKMS